MDVFWYTLSLFSFFERCIARKKKSAFYERCTAPYRKGTWFTPLQSTTKAAACWLGANKASCIFWFLTEKQNCGKESLALCLVIAPFRKRKRFQFSKSHATVTALSFNCGWSSKPCCSFDRGKVNSLHRLNTADVRGEQLGLLSVELPDKKKKKYCTRNK